MFFCYNARRNKKGDNRLPQDKLGLRQIIFTQGLFVAWIVVLVATLCSLYFSEIVGYIPCELCWYQRILMYPLVIILAMAVIRKDNDISVYIIPISGLGMFISLYHYTLQKGVFFNHIADGCTLIPCTTIYINWLGFITIPFLAFTAFIIITILSTLVWKYSRNEE